jgi:hypothetical protein
MGLYLLLASSLTKYEKTYQHMQNQLIIIRTVIKYIFILYVFYIVYVDVLFLHVWSNFSIC